MRLYRWFTEDKDEKIRRMHERLRQEQRIQIEESLQKKSASFSTASTAIKIGRGRVIRAMLLAAGVFGLLLLAKNMEYSTDRVTQKKSLMIKSSVG